MAERLQTVEQDGVDIGCVRIYEATATEQARVVVHLNEDLAHEMPHDYVLNMLNTTQKMHVFSETHGRGGSSGGNAHGVALAVEGRIEQECAL